MAVVLNFMDLKNIMTLVINSSDSYQNGHYSILEAVIMSGARLNSSVNGQLVEWEA